MGEFAIEVRFEAVLYETAMPFRYLVELRVSGVPTGIAAYVWGRQRANQVMAAFIEDGVELLNKHNKFESVLQQVRAMRREEAMAKVQVGDTVKLLVDIGSIKKGRVCRVVEVVEPSFYVSRGSNEWDDEKYPVKVLPVSMPNDPVPLGPKDALPLMRGEFGPLDEDVDD
jgi:hypothetical protein